MLTLVAAWLCLGTTSCDRASKKAQTDRRQWTTEQLKQAAHEGDSTAQLDLAFKYFEGDGVEQEKAQALMWAQRAADDRLPEAQVFLGSLYDSGEGVEKNPRKAVELYKYAADQGNPVAQRILGQMYLSGRTVQKNQKLGRELLEKAAAQNDGDALVELSSCYSDGTGGEQNSEKANELLERALQLRHPQALATFGWMAVRGIQWDENVGEQEGIQMLVEAASQNNATADTALTDHFLVSLYGNEFMPTENAASAFTWIKSKAESGDELAQYRLALCYLRGEGTKADADKGIEWLDAARQSRVSAASVAGFARPWIQKAAESGNPTAQYRLGINELLAGDGDVDSAERWLRSAAEQGYTLAQKYLYHLYLGIMGEATASKKNPTEAIKWLRAAAESGGVHEKASLGAAYLRGEAGEDKRAEGIPLLREAAEGGVATAQSELAEAYLRGEHTPKDELEAYKWALLVAASQDVSAEWAKTIVKALENRLSRFEIAEGQRRAAKFRAAQMQKPAAQSEEIVGSASGFLVSKNGHVITNAHVVADAGEIFVVYRGERLKAELVKVDASTDLALLKVEAATDALPVTSSRGVKMGDAVATVGFPNPTLQGREPKFASGEIAALSGGQDDPKYFQVSVPLQAGNSGGPLTDAAGNVIGVVSAKLNPLASIATTGTVPENVNYAVKGSYLLGFLEASPDVQTGMVEERSSPLDQKELATELTKAAVLVEIEWKSPPDEGPDKS